MNADSWLQMPIFICSNQFIKLDILSRKFQISFRGDLKKFTRIKQLDFQEQFLINSLPEMQVMQSHLKLTKSCNV